MTDLVYLVMPSDVHLAVMRHLLLDSDGCEQAAFMYVRPERGATPRSFQYVEWAPIPLEGFNYRTGAYLELTDATRAAVIKRAHDLDASIVELHSHLGNWPARFSWSDLAGFREFVPHVRWRLKGRPYFAVVVAQNGFDGFAWLSDSQAPEALGGILADSDEYTPTCLSRWDGYYHE